MNEERVEDLQAEIEELRSELRQVKQQQGDDEAQEIQEQIVDQVENSGPDFSRRDFLKMLGGGAAGLGAAAMIPSASGFSVTSDQPFEYFNQSASNASFSVTEGGNVTAPQLGEPADKIQNIHAISVSTDRIGNDQFPNVVVFVDGSDAVAVDTTDASEIDRQDKTQNGLDVIQSAHDALPGSGGHIYIRTGRYSKGSVSGNSVQVLISKDNVTITGDGADTVLTIEDGATDSDKGVKLVHVGGDDGSEGTGTNAYDNFAISNLLLDGNQQNNGGDGDGNTIGNATDHHNLQIQGANFLVYNIWSINATGDGVEPISRSDPAPTKRGVIANCVIRDCWEHCIHFHGATDCVAAGNVCDGEVNGGMLEMYTDDTDNNRILVTNNIFRNGQDFGAELTSSGSSGAKNIWLVNNLIEGCSRNGITLYPNSGDNGSRVHIVNNHIKNNADRGIQTNGANGLVIRGNVIEDNATDGIRVTEGNLAAEELFIQSNYVYNNNTNGNSGNDGVTLRATGSNSFSNCIIANNYVLAEGSNVHTRSIDFSEGTAVSYTDIHCYGNFVKGASGNQINDNFGLDTRKNNPGDATQTKGKLGGFDISSTGIDTKSVSHRLAGDVTPPSLEDVQATLVNPSATDFEAVVWIDNLTSNNFDINVKTTSAASTSSETVEVAWKFETDV